MVMSTFSDLKAAAQVLLEANKLPEYTKLLEGMQKLTELQQQLAESHKETETLRAELAAIRDDGEKLAAMTRTNEFFQDAEGHTYCAHCALVDKRIAPVVWASGAQKNGSSFSQCTRCKQTFHRYVR